MKMEFGTRRAKYIDLSKEKPKWTRALSSEDLQHFESFDLIYRSLCSVLYNYVPTSGHPGGSISSGHVVQSLVFETMDYDVSNPDREEADLLSYAAGHKALGLYALWALRNEVIRLGAPKLLPSNVRFQFRLEDLLGFRRNPITATPLFKKFGSKSLDGHPTPATPFVRLSTGASGVGLGSSVGLAFGAKDFFGSDAPYIHIIEGEGGMTPGRVSEVLASAGTSSLKNVVLHVDWNQASIDSNRVCRDETGAGDYVQWNPMEFAYLHDWNVIFVPDGFDFQQVWMAQQMAQSIDNDQPTAIVYRTIKGWQYGIEGKASHGAGHKFCSEGFLNSLKPLLDKGFGSVSICKEHEQRCQNGKNEEVVEECFWEALTVIRTAMEKTPEMIQGLGKKLIQSKERLEKRNRKPREKAPQLEKVFQIAKSQTQKIPEELALKPGTSTTLRGELGRALNFYNRASQGALLSASADLLGSTSTNLVAKGFKEGFFHSTSNPEARLLSVGGICEDGISAVLSGISSWGHHIGIGSSYAAFIAPLGHIASRLHAIGNQSRQATVPGEPYKPFILICGHAGTKTGEDGPTHADPQCLQIFQENFPQGTSITLTPWDPAEIWTLLSSALEKRPSVIAPFVTRPNEVVLDRAALGLAPVTSAEKGVYLLRKAKGKPVGTLVLQGSEVAYAFLLDALPLLLKEGLDVNVYYVASAELFDLLPSSEKEKIFPSQDSEKAMGITGFTLPTMYHWIRSERGRAATLYPFQKGHYLGSGQAQRVVEEAGLDGLSQYKAIKKFFS